MIYPSNTVNQHHFKGKALPILQTIIQKMEKCTDFIRENRLKPHQSHTETLLIDTLPFPELNWLGRARTAHLRPSGGYQVQRALVTGAERQGQELPFGSARGGWGSRSLQQCFCSLFNSLLLVWFIRRGNFGLWLWCRTNPRKVLHVQKCCPQHTSLQIKQSPSRVWGYCTWGTTHGDENLLYRF